MKHSIDYIFCIFFVLSFYPSTVEAGLKRQHTITGQTMGTYYKIKYIGGLKESQKIWKQKVETRLKEINKRLSMYNPESELNIFNQSVIEEPARVSSDFFTIIQKAKNLYQLTDGAWDGTVKPLVDLWGFGVKTRAAIIPELKTIQNTLTRTGFEHIKILSHRNIIRQKDVTLDLGSIAKGYGVDEVAHLFLSSNIQDVLVEIGGELFASGKNKKGEPWSVGISQPDKNLTRQTLFKIIRLDNQAIATSGNYRNFFELDKTTYSHIINPKTGFPVKNNIVSASVISKNCTFADGLATALMVMDVKEGIDLVNLLDGTECLIIQKINPDKNDLKTSKLISHSSKNFGAMLVKPN